MSLTTSSNRNRRKTRVVRTCRSYMYYSIARFRAVSRLVLLGAYRLEFEVPELRGDPSKEDCCGLHVLPHRLFGYGNPSEMIYRVGVATSETLVLGAI